MTADDPLADMTPEQARELAGLVDDYDPRRPVHRFADEFTDSLKLQPENERRGWIAYLLEGLEDECGVGILKDFEAVLSERRGAGTW